MDRKNENQFQLKKTASDMVKSLLIAYVVTGIFLLILTLLLYKMGLSEQKVNIGVILIYVIATFSGGFVMGKLSMTHKFLWGLVIRHIPALKTDIERIISDYEKQYPPDNNMDSSNL